MSTPVTPVADGEDAMLSTYTKEELVRWEVDTLASHVVEQQSELHNLIQIQALPPVPTSLSVTHPNTYKKILKRVRLAMKQAIEMQMRVQRPPSSGRVKAWVYEAYVPTLQLVDEIFDIKDADLERGWKSFSLQEFARICRWDLKVSVHVDEPAPLIIKGRVRMDWDEVVNSFIVNGIYGFASLWNHE